MTTYHLELMQAVKDLGETLNLDADGIKSLQDFVLDKEKEAYRQGNRSGIRWARENPATKRLALDTDDKLSRIKSIINE